VLATAKVKTGKLVGPARVCRERLTATAPYQEPPRGGCAAQRHYPVGPIRVGQIQHRHQAQQREAGWLVPVVTRVAELRVAGSRVTVTDPPADEMSNSGVDANSRMSVEK
jgi:hypothetical protein